MANKILLQCFGVKLLEDEILKMIDVETLNSIKQKNAHPYFRAYSICHEGISQPKLLGEAENRIPISWTRKAVQSLKNIVLKGIKFFKGHNTDNSTNNRPDFGEVVANKEIEIDGKLHHIVIGYFPDKESIKNDDIVSQEGLWNFVKTSGQMIAESVENITGIALGNSDYESPAFDGARQLGAVQCMVQAFEDAGGESDKNKTGGDPARKKETIMTLKDVISYIQDNKVHVAQLGFTLEDVKADRVLGKAFEDLERENQKLKKDSEQFATDKKAFEEKIKEFELKDNLSKAKIKFSEIVKNAKIGEKEKLFIQKRFDKETIEDLTDNGLNKFFNDKIEEFKTDIAPLLGKETIVNTDVFMPSQTPAVDETDLTKAENNELLENDYVPLR